MLNTIYQFLAGIGYTHPIHPPVTCIPIGMVIGAFVFGLAARLFKKPELARTARHCIVLAFIGLFPTALFGYMDWQHYYGGAWLFPIKMKIILACVLLVLFVVSMLLHSRLDPGSKKVLVIYFLCFLTVTVIGYFGGELVFGTRVAKKTAPSAGHAGQVQRQAAEVTFAEVARIFEAHCTQCHSGPSAPLGLKLDSYAGVMSGGKNRPVVLSGKPDESELVRRIRGSSQPRMPFGQAPLSEEEIGLVVTWVEEGAPEIKQETN